MAHYALCWELGSGLGHLAALSALGRQLRLRGHEVSCLLPPACAADVALAAGLQVRHWRAIAAPERPFSLSLNYAGNLLRNGYWHTPTVAARVQHWRDLLLELRPDVVIADHAPAALLASRHMQLPRLALGHGFTLPPAASPMPSLQPWLPLDAARLQASEQSWLDAVNPALSASGGQPLQQVSDLFAGATRWLCIEPELDHYAARSDDCYQGSFADRVWQHGPAPDLPQQPFAFVYMSASNRFLPAVLQTLQARGHTVVAYMPGADKLSGIDKAMPAGTWPGMHVLRQPIDLDALQPHCTLAISEGGTYTAASLLKRGIPLLICPRDLEKAVFAWRLQQRGLAQQCNWFSAPGQEAQQLAAAFDRWQTPPALAGFHQQQHQRAPAALHALVQQAEALLA